MDDVIRDTGFRWASLATADRVIRLLRTDAPAFGDGSHEARPRLTANERLERRRQRTVTR